MRPIPPAAAQSSQNRSTQASSPQQQANSPQARPTQVSLPQSQPPESANDKSPSDAQADEAPQPATGPPNWTYSPLQATGPQQTATSPPAAPPKPQRLSSTDKKSQSFPQQQEASSTATCNATCASTCAWKTKARDSIICLVHGSACTYSPSDVLASLQERVVELANTISERDAEIITLKERIAELELIADRAETENEVNAAREFARCAVKEMNEAGAAAGRISNDLRAANNASEHADGASGRDMSDGQSAVKGDKSVPILERSGRSLAHATRTRPSPRARKTAATPKDTTSESGSSTAPATVASPPSDLTPLSQDGVASNHGSADSINSNPQEEFKKKIAMMGGVNPLMGMNPAMMIGQLKGTGRLSKGER